MSADSPAPSDHSPYSLQFEAIGTHWTVTLYQPLDPHARQNLLASVLARIEDFDKCYSRFRADSLVTGMSRSAGHYRLPPDARQLLDFYQQLYEATEGAVTPLIGNLLSDAGYDADYSLQPGNLRPVPEWGDVISYDFPEIELKQPALLDFGAAGKGYLCDLVAETIENHGISHYCVDAGGDIRQHGVPATEDRIGLEHPLIPGQVIGVASVGDGSICGSAANRRTWGKGLAADGGDLHHIMDPHTRQPVRSIAGLWVSAASALEADGLATALFFVPPARLRRAFTFEYLILYDTPDSSPGLRADHSANFPAELFLA